MVGYVALYIPEEREPAEVECYVFKEHRRHHYAEEALKALINTYSSQYTDKDIQLTLRAWIGNLNKPSLELAAKLGFKDKGSAVVSLNDEDEYFTLIGM